MTSQTSKLGRKTRSRRRGYTAAEVIMAIGLFAIGGTGVIAMESASIQGNANARRMDQANAIASVWADRLLRESSLWGSTPPKLAVTGIPVLNTAALFPAYTNPPIPASATPGLSPAFDINGEEVLSGGTGPQQANAIFCAQYQLQVMQTDATRANAPVLYRATIAVWWRRDLGAISVAPMCGDPAFAPTTANYHVVYLTQMIRENG
jgi:type IV pilus assembly protein PilV